MLMEIQSVIAPVKCSNRLNVMNPKDSQCGTEQRPLPCVRLASTKGRFAEVACLAILALEQTVDLCMLRKPRDPKPRQTSHVAQGRRSLEDGLQYLHPEGPRHYKLLKLSVYLARLKRS